MKIDGNNFNSISQMELSKNKRVNIQPKAHSAINHGISSAQNKDLNNRIGILQMALISLDKILDTKTDLSAAKGILEDATFFGKHIFASNMIISDENGILFNANDVLRLIPRDSSDLYLFKKSLKSVRDSIANKLENIKIESSNDFSRVDSGFLKHNASAFSQAHNVDGLRTKLDSLLA